MSTPLTTLFRPSQYEIVNYRSGKVGVSAVPGSGKTFTLSHLAARLVARLSQNNLLDEQEVLIVTFTNSAVNSIKARVGNIIQTQRGLLPYIGYRVRTLHGLAHEIVRERPSLVGLMEDFKIIDERQANAKLKDVITMWVRASGTQLLTTYGKPDLDTTGNSGNRLRNNDLPDLVESIARSFIRQAKDRLLRPEFLRAQLEAAKADGISLPLAEIGVEIYESYQRSLAYQGAVDFDDLARLAIQALETDPDYLRRLQRRYPVILEDESQDSSLLQERMLRMLSDGKNWVRVGDPNQAINTTFTNSNLEFLRNFLTETGVKAYSLAEAGRSARRIMDLANTLIRWTVRDHPVPELRSAFYEQDIKPTPPGDAKPNPSEDNALVYIQSPTDEYTPEKEVRTVVDSLARWLPEHPDETVAVLVPENRHGFRVSEMLKERGLPHEELLRSTSATRDAAETIRLVLAYLDTPMRAMQLANLYSHIWWPAHLGKTMITEEAEKLLNGALEALRHIDEIETFLWPVEGVSPLNALILNDPPLELLDDLGEFRLLIMRWLNALILPIDQLILTLAQDLFTAPADIALSYKIAQVLRLTQVDQPDMRLPQFVEMLREISQNERRFLGFDDVEQGYEPQVGKVTVATMHAAKGLEWDRVYLLAVSNYGFPSAMPYDKYISEKWFVRDNLNPDAEVQAQLEALVSGHPYIEGEASQQARIDYAAERLRLFYVGITRAKKELIITWNTGTNKNHKNQAALPLVALYEYAHGTLKI